MYKKTAFEIQKKSQRPRYGLFMFVPDGLTHHRHVSFQQ